jgi:predicted RNase H-like nuclease (RuvC/YqgF family)
MESLWRRVKELEEEDAQLKANVRALRLELEDAREELERLKAWPDYGVSSVTD